MDPLGEASGPLRDPQELVTGGRWSAGLGELGDRRMTHLVPDVKVPDHVAVELLHHLAVGADEHVDGHTAVRVVRRRKVGHRPRRDAQSSAHCPKPIRVSSAVKKMSQSWPWTTRLVTGGDDAGKDPALAVLDGRLGLPVLLKNAQRTGPLGGRRAALVVVRPVALQHSVVVDRVDLPPKTRRVNTSPAWASWPISWSKWFS